MLRITLVCEYAIFLRYVLHCIMQVSAFGRFTDLPKMDTLQIGRRNQTANAIMDLATDSKQYLARTHAWRNNVA